VRRHFADGALGQPEEPGQAGFGDGGVIGGGVLGERLGDDHARVVDQGVDAAEAPERRVDDLAGSGGCGEFCGHGEQVQVL
jgi:hypothetical protein